MWPHADMRDGGILQSRGKTLIDVMNSLYEEYGVYQHSMINAEFEGAQGMETMKSLMSGLRENLPTG